MNNIFIDDWLDTKIMTYLYNESFNCPSEDRIDNLQINDFVKISNKNERFWVKIKKITNLYFLGEIDNYLQFNDKYDYKDLVIFEKNNIYDLKKQKKLKFNIK